MVRENIVGKVYGRLTVIGDAGFKVYPSGERKKQVEVQCSCELKTTLTVTINALKTGNTRSCGCKRLESLVIRNTNHNLRYTLEYTLWSHIIDRTTNPNNLKHINYGGRGITVYAAWVNDFMAFYNWLKENIGLHPGKPYSLDRVDNNGNYEPGNLRWATPSQQAINQRIRKTNTSGSKGVSWYLKLNKWMVSISVNGKRLHLGYFSNKEEAIEARKEAERLRESLEPNAAIAWIKLYRSM